MNLSSQNCRAQRKAATEARCDPARAARRTPAEQAMLALIGDIVAEQLWAAATGGSVTAGKPAKDDA